MFANAVKSAKTGTENSLMRSRYSLECHSTKALSGAGHELREAPLGSPPEDGPRTPAADRRKCRLSWISNPPRTAGTSAEWSFG